MKHRGLFLVLEGIDGVGKDTQAQRLVTTAQQRGLSVCKFAFPDYATPVGGDITGYQRGDFGELDVIHPRLASYPYAVNRLEAQSALEKALASHELVVCVRYASSNAAFMAARVPPQERPTFRTWLEELDYSVLGNVRPDKIILLDLPAELAATLVAKHNLGRRDIHDENLAFQTMVRQEYLGLAANKSVWHVINCAGPNGEAIRSVEDIEAELSSIVFDDLLPAHRQANV